MITSKKDIKEYLVNDIGVYYSPIIFFFVIIKLKLFGSERVPIWQVMYTLRHYEYYHNKGRLNYNQKIIKHFWRLLYRHYEIKHNIFIGVNISERGLHLVHPGFRHMNKVARIGKNCTILPMVLIGKKTPNNNGIAYIGNNCYISTGVTILAPVKIGNNVTIGAGAVVTKDIPDNTVVGGIPARIIKTKES